MRIQNKPQQVYEPREDSFFLASYVEKLTEGKEVLDMGTGTGIQALKAYKAGAKEVTAVDVNEKAVELVKKNVKENDVEVEVKQSDLFENVEGEFDLIVFNPPYLPLDNAYRNDKISRAIFGGETGKELILDFLEEANSYLGEEGEILMIISSKTGKEEIVDHSNNKGYEVELLGVKKLSFEKLYVLKLAYQ